MIRRTLLAATIAASLTSASAQAPSAQLNTVLSQLDAASQRFHNAQATVQYDNYTRVVRDHALQTGSIYIERTRGNERTASGEEMGALFFDLGPDNKPSPTPAKVISYGGGLLQIYSPGLNQVDIFKAGANQAKYESFLTLGFGGSGTDLRKAWDITDQGAETIDGVKTEKLDLISHDPGVLNMFSHVTIWVDPARGISLKQIFYAPAGDTRTATYTNIKLNTRIDTKPYAISKKAQRVAH